MNPFIALAEDPVAALAWFGYALAMVALTVGAAHFAFRLLTRVYVRWERNHTQPEWWGGWIPPKYETGLIIVSLLSLAVASWATGTILWMLA